MLQSIRDKITGWFATVFLGAIGVVFVFWGVDMGRNSDVRYAVRVNGEGIPIEKVRRAWQVKEQEMQQQFRGALPEPLRAAQQRALVEQSIQIELLTQQTQKMGYRVSDAALREAIVGNPRWQADGKFSPALYALEARQQGMTPAQLDEEMRRSMQLNQIAGGIATTSFVTPIELARRQALEGEQREVDYAVVPASSFLSSVTVSDADIQKYYDAHQSEYMTPESADVEYIELRLADLEREVPMDDAALQAYYEQVKERLTTPERRRARHILISVGDGVDDAAAKKTAEEVLAKVKAGGDFAALAKQYSKDAVSAAKGGDLDWAARGMFVGPFEDALFAMNKGEVRGPIKTQFGYHVIRLDDIEGGGVKSFAEARAELETEYRRDKAQNLFYDRSQKLADEAFKALTELTTVGSALNLPVKKVSGFTRQGGGELGNDSKVIEAVFRAESVDKGENSSLVTLGDDRALVLRVAAHKTPTQLPLTAVRTSIEMKVKDQMAREAAAKRGAELLAKVTSGTAWAAVLSEAKLTSIGKRKIGRDDASVIASVRKTAFAVPHASVDASKPAYRGTGTEDGGYALVAVSSVTPGMLEAGTPESAAKMRQSTQALGESEFGAYMADLERRAKIERNPRIFE